MVHVWCGCAPVYCFTCARLPVCVHVFGLTCTLPCVRRRLPSHRFWGGHPDPPGCTVFREALYPCACLTSLGAAGRILASQESHDRPLTSGAAEFRFFSCSETRVWTRSKQASTRNPKHRTCLRTLPKCLLSCTVALHSHGCVGVHAPQKHYLLLGLQLLPSSVCFC